MAHEVRVRREGRDLFVSTPYNTVFLKKARTIAGSWTGGEWKFDARDEARVRDALMKAFGQDGLRNETCTARFAFHEGFDACCDPIRLQGREIAKATGRDSGAKLGEGVVLLEGECRSGGSAKNWLTRLVPGTEILVRDFPRWVVEKWASEPDQHKFDCSVEAEDGLIADRETLVREREALVARIAELDVAILAAAD